MTPATKRIILGRIEALSDTQHRVLWELINIHGNKSAYTSDKAYPEPGETEFLVLECYGLVQPVSKRQGMTDKVVTHYRTRDNVFKLRRLIHKRGK